MNRRDDVLGLTLAEVGLFVVFILLLVGLTKPDLAEKLRGAEEMIRTLDMRLNHARANWAAARERIRFLQGQLQELQSPQRPSCREAGVADGFLFSLTIEGRQRLRLAGGQLFTFPELLEFFRSDLEDANRGRCVHAISVSYIPDVSIDAYDAALRELEQHFYIRRDLPR